MMQIETNMTEIYNVDKSKTTNIADIKIDESKAVQDRVQDYLEQIKDPHYITVGNVLVQMDYADTDYTFNDRYKRAVINAKL